jgi:hypothetical protein
MMPGFPAETSIGPGLQSASAGQRGLRRCCMSRGYRPLGASLPETTLTRVNAKVLLVLGIQVGAERRDDPAPTPLSLPMLQRGHPTFPAGRL